MKPVIRKLLFGGEGAATVFADIGLTILRLGTGLGISLGHGLGKVWGPEGFGPSPQFVAGVQGLGLPLPTAFAWLAALTEFAGGLLLAAGLFTRPAALFLSINMAVAAFVVHADAPLFMTGQGAAKEPALLYLLPFVFFIFAGGGWFSVDHLLVGTGRASRRNHA
ncbi:DoxX family protein [Fontivita pretiosa]|uniref:DoxX family protein n=1 Tax=Fontivita pretiosa TaxID=2989684 RepID=UPI003D18628D